MIDVARWMVWTGSSWGPIDLRFQVGTGTNFLYMPDPQVWDGGSWSQGGPSSGGLEERTVELRAVSSASYEGNGLLRARDSLCYHGRFDNTYGVQKSLWTFNVPPDVRGCVTVGSVEMSVMMKHMYSLSAPGTVGVVLHSGAYQASPPAMWPAVSGVIGTWPGYRGQWLSGQRWIPIGSRIVPGSGFSAGLTVAESFRAAGAQGLGLWTTSTSPNDYGYADGDPGSAEGPGLRVRYTVRTG